MTSPNSLPRLEGDGWANWSELATFLAAIERRAVSCVDRLLTAKLSR